MFFRFFFFLGKEAGDIQADVLAVNTGHLQDVVMYTGLQRFADLDDIGSQQNTDRDRDAEFLILVADVDRVFLCRGDVFCLFQRSLCYIYENIR